MSASPQVGAAANADAAESSAGVHASRRLSRLAWRSVAVFCAIGIAFLVGRHVADAPRRVTALALTRTVPAYHQLVPDDLTPVQVRRPGNGVAVSPAQLIGHYTTRPLSHGNVVQLRDVGPTVPDGVSINEVVSLEGDAALALGGQLSAGDHVDVVASGTPATHIAVLRRAFVLAVQRVDPDRWVVTIAAPSSVSDSAAIMFVDGQVITVRVP